MMKTFTTLFSILLLMALGATASPQNGLHDSWTEGHTMSSLSGLDVLDFVTALSAQQTRMTAQQSRMGTHQSKVGTQQTSTARAAQQNGTLPQQPGTALTNKSQAYTMTFDSLHGISWEPSIQAWVHRYRAVYVYDDLMRPVESRDYLRDDEQDGWRPFSKRVLSYNDQGLLSGLTRSLNWLGAGTMYEHLVIELYYDNAGRLDSVVTHSADDFQVLNRTTTELFTYDDEGRPERIDALTWDDTDAHWNLTSYKLIDYDSEGNRLLLERYYIGKDIDGHLYWQYEYAYDGEGRLVGELVSSLNFASLQIEPDFREDYVYNDEGDRAERRDYTYYKGAWEPYSLTEYTYNPTIEYIDVASMDFMFELLYYDRVGISGKPPNKMLAETASYYYQDGEFGLTNKAVYFVSEKSADSESLLTGVADLKLATPALYPNPAGDHITLEWEAATHEWLTLEVYHITGSLVMRREVESGQQLSIDQLHAGLYLYRLTNGQAIIQAGKLMKR